MRRRHSLRFRVALAFAGLGAILSLLFAIGIWFAAQDVSRRLIDETLDAELADYLTRRARNPHSLPPTTASLTGYLLGPNAPPVDLPPEIANLPPGRHDATIANIPYRIAVADRDGERYVLLFNETQQGKREKHFLVYLATGAGMITLLVVVGGLWLAGQVIAPVSELANAIRHADPQNPPCLSRESGPGDEIDAMAEAFDHYLARIAAFAERERAFAADASHELRTPLATIRGAAEVLADNPGLDAAQSARIARITRASDEMGELIAALLLLSREGNPLLETPCNTGRIVRDCCARYQHLATSRQTRIEIEAAADVPLLVPPAFMIIVVGNLVHNAVTHTRNGLVRVVLDTEKLVVSDTGTGIQPADLDHVFERHFRGPDSSGAGIGLSLVKRICERLGWRIHLSSDPGGGTTVTLRLTS